MSPKNKTLKKGTKSKSPSSSASKSKSPSSSASKPKSFFKKLISFATKKKKPNVYLSEKDIDIVMNETDQIIKHKLNQEDIKISDIKKVLRKVSYKPDFESYFYIGESREEALKKINATRAFIKRALHREQLIALIFEWSKGYIELDAFTESTKRRAEMDR